MSLGLLGYSLDIVYRYDCQLTLEVGIVIK